MIFSCLTWNTAKRIKHINKQVEIITNSKSDIIALQEITINSEKLFKKYLSKKYKNVVSSFDLVADKKVLFGKRMFGQIIATNYPIKSENPDKFMVPWTERILSVKISINNKVIIFHTTHIPPGSSNGWIKIETLNGIYERLVKTKESLNILCGDFNTPKQELEDKGLVTFAQNINAKGEIKMKGNFRGGKGIDWDKGERNIILGLSNIGIEDSFRKLYAYNTQEFSWSFKRKDKILKRRFDHFFASDKIRVVSAKYLHNQGNTSDHSPLKVEYYYES